MSLEKSRQGRNAIRYLKLSPEGLAYFRGNGVDVSEGPYRVIGGPYSSCGTLGPTSHPAFNEEIFTEYGYRAYAVVDETGVPFDYLVYEDQILA